MKTKAEQKTEAKPATSKKPQQKIAPISKTPSSDKRNTASKSLATRKSSAKKTSSKDLEGSIVGLEEFSISIIKPGEGKERIWRTKNFQQFPAQKEFGFPDMAPELPSQYGEPKLVLMPKDPEYMYCYWELPPALVNDREKEKLPNGNYRETLKINWESKSLFEPNFTFIPVFFWARKWYFGVPKVGQCYEVELGWLSESGHFISIIRSNLSELPESWSATQKRLAEQGEILAYSSNHTQTLGSSGHLVVEDNRALVPDWNLSSESMTSSSWSRGISQASSPESLSSQIPTSSKPRSSSSKPSVNPKSRLEVTGKVQFGTTIRIGGQALPTDEQGNFRVEFPYNENILTLELIAASGASRSLTYDLKELVLT